MSDTIDNYLMITLFYTHTSFKLKFPQRSQYLFKFLGVSIPKPIAENGIPEQSLDMSLIWHIYTNLNLQFNCKVPATQLTWVPPTSPGS